MASRDRFVRVLTHLTRLPIAIGGALLIALVSIAIAWYMSSAPSIQTYTPVSMGPITQEVDVSGTVKAATNANLSFQTTGQIASIAVSVGDHVKAGETLLTLHNETQSAALALAKANLETQKAKLASLLAGTRPEQLAIDQTTATQAQTALANAIQSAYISADDAVHAKADQVFSNARLPVATLLPLIPDASLVNRVEAERVSLESVIADMQTLSVASGEESITTSDAMRSDLGAVSTFLNNLSTALAEAVPDTSYSAATITGYQTSVNTARTEVSTALIALTTAETAYKSATGALSLAQAGATKDDIAAQQAAVDAAQASVDSAQTALAQTYLVAPIAGSVSVQSADLGETVTPGQSLVSLVSDAACEIDANVSEIDIAKLAVGDPVVVTLDAYPGATFAATVTTVPPATATSDGSSYTVTVTFDTNDPRIKPGLSANLAITTAEVSNALLVPTSAIITNGTEQFVYVNRSGTPVKTLIKTGITGKNGMTEVTSGLIAGDEVLTFGTAVSR